MGIEKADYIELTLFATGKNGQYLVPRLKKSEIQDVVEAPKSKKGSYIININNGILHVQESKAEILTRLED